MISRRAFQKKVVSGVGSWLSYSFWLVIGLPGCALSAKAPVSDNSTVSTGGNCSANGTHITIEANHGHTIVITAADIQAGVQKDYSIQGTANHDHIVTLTAANFATLQGNQGVAPISSITNNHNHTLIVNCA